MISKSKFIKSQQCTKYLYLSEEYPELYKPDTQITWLTQNGELVDEMARRLYFGGLNLYTGEIKDSKVLADITTRALMSNHNTLYQPTFISADGRLMFRGDILIKCQRKWKLIEVKSSTRIKEPKHIFEIGFMYRVLATLGLEKKIEIHIAYLNKDYMLDGELDLNQLFIIEDVTARARKNKTLVDKILFRLDDALNKKYPPQSKIGKHCFADGKCAFINHCWKDVSENNITNIGRMTESKISRLIDSGITNIEDISSDEKFSSRQWIEINAAIEKRPAIKIRKIKEFLNTINSEQLLFIDFESIMPPVPIINKTYVYDQICFQYCLVVQSNAEGSRTVMRKDFIADPGIDPRRAFIEQLLYDTKIPGDIIVYNSRFEAGRLNELAEKFPEYKKEIQERVARIKDLMTPFEKRYYYHPKFKGNHTIKIVSQVLCPDINYSTLDIRDGTMAMQAFATLHKRSIQDQWKIKEQLKEYCYTDVVSMIRVMEELNKITSKEERRIHVD